MLSRSRPGSAWNSCSDRRQVMLARAKRRRPAPRKARLSGSFVRWLRTSFELGDAVGHLASFGQVLPSACAGRGGRKRAPRLPTCSRQGLADPGPAGSGAAHGHVLVRGFRNKLQNSELMEVVGTLTEDHLPHGFSWELVQGDVVAGRILDRFGCPTDPTCDSPLVLVCPIRALGVPEVLILFRYLRPPSRRRNRAALL
jgi:hypothetical protein